MCEYCGCQSVSAIEDLTREHDTVVGLISAVRTAEDTDRMAALARDIAGVLAPHTEVEEHGLFPLLADDFPDQISALESEHRLVESVLAEAAHGTPTDPAWPTRLIETLDLLRDHILKEQDGVFPAALTTLSGTDWDTVDKVRAALRSDHKGGGVPGRDGLNHPCP
ncbi:hemerythrin domain-containing protein [Paractinoplanes atraurantiacus]|uniref:Hemerythrin HHE cation binding domain-containing protein n=1 Tax=Paractinoplanes atraurantiacus TaxID=1036182 RepID=A0A285IDB8_9ACTN|nr:hemerythrin domain-containing protein [Actinoplanes atraurantiacus]SNY45974.1 Hemerythrin HHE cation binding domain-containing protein [Actinoplanes atraurantiacus]